MILHIRVVSPRPLTASLLDRLGEWPDVRNLVVQSGAARQPDGDAVQFDVHSRRANAVLEQLRALQLDRLGPIIV